MINVVVSPPESEITPEDWRQTPERVRAWIMGVWEEVKQLKAMVEKFQEAGNRNSQNSSQPPSQGRPEQKPAKEKPSQLRQRGGRPDHRGYHRLLVEQVDEVIHHRPVRCRRCGALLLGDDPNPYRHQVTELPTVKSSVVEHQVHCINCPCCGLINRGEFPSEVGASQFVKRILSVVETCRQQRRPFFDFLRQALSVYRAR